MKRAANAGHRTWRKDRQTAEALESASAQPHYYVDGDDAGGGPRLRRVVPYRHVHEIFAKRRWLNKPLLEVLCAEFASQPRSYYEAAIGLGLITVLPTASLGALSGPSLAYRPLRDGDMIVHVMHRHEPPCSAESLDLCGRIVSITPDVVVIDKPASLPAHPCGGFTKNSVQRILAREGPPGIGHGISVEMNVAAVPFGACGERGNRGDGGVGDDGCDATPGAPFLHAVHRLDRRVSGLLILARNPAAAAKFSRQLAASGGGGGGGVSSSSCGGGSAQKWYVARVRGSFPGSAAEAWPLDRDALRVAAMAAQGGSVLRVGRPSSGDGGGGGDGCGDGGTGGFLCDYDEDSDDDDMDDGTSPAYPDRGEPFLVDCGIKLLTHSTGAGVGGVAVGSGAVASTAAAVADAARKRCDGRQVCARDGKASRTIFQLLGHVPAGHGGGGGSGASVKVGGGVTAGTSGAMRGAMRGAPDSLNSPVDGQEQSLVRCRPLTGRTHQIRLHLKLLGFPIANDNIYLDDAPGDAPGHPAPTSDATGPDMRPFTGAGLGLGGSGEAAAAANIDTEKGGADEARGGRESTSETVTSESMSEAGRLRALCVCCQRGETFAFSPEQLRTDGLWLHAYKYAAATAEAPAIEAPTEAAAAKSAATLEAQPKRRREWGFRTRGLPSWADLSR